MSKIKVAVVGVGNCFSSLYQGVGYYSERPDEVISGIAHLDIGGYKATDLEFVLAIDVDERKLVLPLSSAIFVEPNVARVFHQKPAPGPNPLVINGHRLDGVSTFMETEPASRGFRPLSTDETREQAKERLVQALKVHGADVLLNYLPVGSNEATEFYAEVALEAGVSFINNIPVLNLNHPDWEDRFIDAGIPYIGSDIKSQFGASILSQMLQELAFDRGMEVDFHQQLNVGGNTDFNNMMVQSRLLDKKVSKENVIRAQNDLRDIPVNEDALFAGPSTYIPYLKDNKVAYFNLRLRGFGGAPVEVDVKLSVQDSENSAGVVIDAIRFIKVARELGIRGCLRGPSAFTQKSPPKQLTMEEAKYECDALAKRELTPITLRQLSNESAKAFAREELAEGGMDYLRVLEKKRQSNAERGI